MNPHEQAYLDEARSHFQTRLKYFNHVRLLNNLMAVINRDGGHKADTYACIEDAVDGCILAVSNLIHNKGDKP